MSEEGNVDEPAPAPTKKSYQQTLVEEQKKLNRLVQDQRRSVGRIRIPGQLERWTQVKEELGLTSHEAVAKVLLDSYNKAHDTEAQSINVDKDLMTTFEEFKVKVDLTTDEVIKFFLSLNVLPGQHVIAVDGDIIKMFDDLKEKLSLSSSQTMKFLFDLYEGSGLKTGPASQDSSSSIAETVKQAVREEITSLRREVLMLTSQTRYGASLKKDGLVQSNKASGYQPPVSEALYDSSVEHNGYQTLLTDSQDPSTIQTGYQTDGQLAGITDKGYQLGQSTGSQVFYPAEGIPSPLNANSSLESSNKRRSRKSQPQRVVSEAETPVIDLDVEEMEVDGDLQLVNNINGPQMVNVNGNGNSVDVSSQYQYVLNASMDNNTQTSLEEDINTVNMSSLQTENQSMSEADTSTSLVNSPDTLNSNETCFFCPYCTYRTPIIARLKRHMTIHTGKVFKCSKCEKSYTEEYKLREHFGIKHEKSVHFECESCKRDFTSKGGLKYHTKTMHRKEYDYWCDACCKGFNDAHTYEVHIEIKHTRMAPFTCKNCSGLFKTVASLRMHQKSCLKTDKKNYFNRFPCEICSEKFSSFHELKEHSNSKHSNITPFSCSCGLEFKLRASYNGHRHNCRIAIALENETKNRGKETSDGLKNVAVVNVESLSEKYGAKSLDFMNQTTKDVPKPENSEKESGKSSNIETENGAFSDDGLTSIQIFNLESGEQFMLSDKQNSGAEHVSGGTEENLVMHCCEVCDYKTPKASHMKRHTMIHTGKKFKCDKCPKSFNEKGKLKTHMMSKHKGHAKYKCEVCYRTFSSKGGIQYHQQTKHSNNHKYRCEVCEKGFNQLQHYMGHKNTHSGIRPYICDICNRGFSYPSVLSAHRKICRGKEDESVMEEQLHPCSHCGEKFFMEVSLEEHIKKEHSNEFSSVLCDCGVVFTDEDVYNEHKPACSGATVSHMFIKAEAGNGVAMDKDLDSSDFKQISPEKFNRLISQPVFPT